MKKIMSLLFIFLTLTFLYEAPTSAQTAQRIQFAKGKTSAVVKGETGSNGVAYVVKANSGQKLILTLAPDSGVGIKVTMNCADGEMVLLREEKGGTYEIGLDMSDDYTIFIGSTDHSSISFSLTVKITKLADV